MRRPHLSGPRHRTMIARHRSLVPILALVAAHAAIVVGGPALHALPGLRHAPALGADCHAPAWPATPEHDDDCSVCGLAQLAATLVTPLAVSAPEPLAPVAVAPTPPHAPAPVPLAHLGRAPPRDLVA